jgi:hypothetical protein
MGNKKRGSKKGGKSAGTVTVTVTPTQGSPTEKTLDLAKCATLEGALKACGITPDRKDITVNGTPATDFTAGLKAGDKIGIAERPQGS